jgi:hypothetical protein
MLSYYILLLVCANTKHASLDIGTFLYKHQHTCQADLRLYKEKYNGACEQLLVECKKKTFEDVDQ